MTRPENGPVTPIYVKTDPRMPWPDDTFFYLMTADGLFACRNHKFFRSCVPAPRWPSELARQDTSLNVAYLVYNTPTSFECAFRRPPPAGAGETAHYSAIKRLRNITNELFCVD